MQLSSGGVTSYVIFAHLRDRPWTTRHYKWLNGGGKGYSHKSNLYYYRSYHHNLISSKPSLNYLKYNMWMWIPFLYSNLSKAKSLDRLHIFISIIFAPTLFNLTNFLLTCAKFFFLNNVIASLCWTCPSYLKRFYFILSPILSLNAFKCAPF